MISQESFESKVGGNEGAGATPAATELVTPCMMKENPVIPTHPNRSNSSPQENKTFHFDDVNLSQVSVPNSEL